MSEIRNPEYPKGMTMRDLIGASEGMWCKWCERKPGQITDLGATNVRFEWADANHDGMCPVPFMRAAEAKLSKTEEALYNTIEEGVAHAFLNIDHDDKRARVLTQEEVAAAEALAGDEEA